MGVDAFVLDGIVDIVNELVGDLGEHAALCPDQIILYLAEPVMTFETSRSFGV